MNELTALLESTVTLQRVRTIEECTVVTLVPSINLTAELNESALSMYPNLHPNLKCDVMSYGLAYAYHYNESTLQLVDIP